MEDVAAAAGERGTDPSSTKWTLALLLVVGAVLRFAWLEHQSFWYDESVSVRLASQPLQDILTGRAKDLGNPPFYIAALHLWMRVFGSGDAAVRALSAAAGVASIPLVYAVGRRLAGRQVGLIAAAIFCVAPVQIHFAQEARAYALVTLLCLISVCSILRAANGPGRNGWWMTFAFSTFLAFYTHYFAFLVAAAEAIWFFRVHRHSRGMTCRFVAATGAATSVFALAWLPALLAQTSIQGNLVRAPGMWMAHVAATPMVLGVGQTLAWRDLATPARLVAGVIAASTLAGLAAAGAWRLRREKPALMLLTAWLLLPVAVPVLVSATLFPFYYARYALPGAPAYYVLIAAGITAARPRVRWPLVAVLALLGAVSLGTYFTVLIKQDWRAAAAWITAHREPADIVMFAPAIGETSFAHYAGHDETRVRLLKPPDADLAHRYWGAPAGDSRARPVEPAAQTEGRIWLVLSDIESGTRGYYRELFEREWMRVAGRRFAGIEILVFDRP